MSKDHGKGTKRKRRFSRRTTPGAVPGTLAPDPCSAKPVIRVIAYGPEGFVEEPVERADDLNRFLGKWPVVWVNVDGLGDAETIAGIGRVFGLHKLALEDVVNMHQRPKLEPYAEHLFIVVREVSHAEGGERLETDQIGMFLGKAFVVTFQDRAGDCFNPVRERIRHARGRIRVAGPDYLAYALIDAVVDCYFPVLETYGERMEELEHDVIELKTTETVARVHAVKRDLLTLRRALWPEREVISSLLRDPNPLIADETRVYLRDCYDHAVQLIDVLETYRELGSDLVDIYFSGVSTRMNEVMRFLTVISTIFMPLGFIAGVYGMNFDRRSGLNMPELGWAWGYPFALLLMAAVAAVMLAYFWRKGWLRRSPGAHAARAKAANRDRDG